MTVLLMTYNRTINYRKNEYFTATLTLYIYVITMENAETSTIEETFDTLSAVHLKWFYTDMLKNVRNVGTELKEKMDERERLIKLYDEERARDDASEDVMSDLKKGIEQLRLEVIELKTKTEKAYAELDAFEKQHNITE